jgi:hypothetical protein
MYPYYIDWLSINNQKHWNEAEISILIDTNQRVKNDMICFNCDYYFFDAYPVLIKNIDIDTITIGYGHFIPLITEAKDSLGNWRAIEEEWKYGCGNGVGSIILPPNEIGISATTIYQGDYKTKMRLRIADNFSNEYDGYINYRQFESKFNDEGEYKEEYKQELKKK